MIHFVKLLCSADCRGAADKCPNAVRGVPGSNPGSGTDVVFVRCWFPCLLCFLLLTFETGMESGKKSTKVAKAIRTCIYRFFLTIHAASQISFDFQTFGKKSLRNQKRIRSIRIVGLYTHILSYFDAHHRMSCGQPHNQHG